MAVPSVIARLLPSTKPSPRVRVLSMHPRQVNSAIQSPSCHIANITLCSSRSSISYCHLSFIVHIVYPKCVLIRSATCWLLGSVCCPAVIVDFGWPSFVCLHWGVVDESYPSYYKLSGGIMAAGSPGHIPVACYRPSDYPSYYRRAASLCWMATSGSPP